MLQYTWILSDGRIACNAGTATRALDSVSNLLFATVAESRANGDGSADLVFELGAVLDVIGDTVVTKDAVRVAEDDPAFEWRTEAEHGRIEDSMITNI